MPPGTAHRGRQKGELIFSKPEELTPLLKKVKAFKSASQAILKNAWKRPYGI